VVCLDTPHAKAALKLHVNQTDANGAWGLAHRHTGRFREVAVNPPFGLRSGKGCAGAAPYVCGGAGSVIAAPGIFSAGADGGIGSAKRDRQALAANGSLKYCVS